MTSNVFGWMLNLAQSINPDFLALTSQVCTTEITTLRNFMSTKTLLHSTCMLYSNKLLWRRQL